MSKLNHNCSRSFFNSQKEKTSDPIEPLGLDFLDEMSTAPSKEHGHSVQATVNVTPRGDSSGDVTYDYNN